MKKTFLLGSYIVFFVFATAQTQFNKVLYDSVSPGIISNVISFDSNSNVAMYAHYNNYGIYDFSALCIDEHGNVLWEKEMFASDSIHGSYLTLNTLQKDSSGFYCHVKTSGGTSGTGKFSLIIWDSCFNISHFKDTIGFYEYVGGIVKYFNGDFFIAGQFYDTVTQKHIANIVKMDSLGNIIWNKVVDNVAYSSSDKIIISSDGNIIVGGRHGGGDYDQWMLSKMDTSGNIIWQRYYGRNGIYPDGDITGIFETSDSCFLVSGKYPAVSIQGGYEFYYDGCLRKISTDGEQLLEKKYRRYYYTPDIETVDLSNDIVSVKTDGTYIYIIGSEWNDSLCGTIPYLSKLTMDGDIMWKRSYHSEGSYICEQFFRSFDLTPDGGFIMGGDGKYGYIGISPPQQPWIVKADSLGMDGVCNIEPPALNVDIDFPDTLYCGDTISCMLRLSGKSAPYQLSFSTGQTIDSIFYPPVWMPHNMELGEVVVFSPRYNYATFYETEATKVGLNLEQSIHKPIQVVVPNRIGLQQITIEVRDFYGESKTITKEINVVGDCESGIENIAEQSVSVYPNPASESITIAGENIVEIEICNLLGEVVYEMQRCNGNNVISTENMPAGSYFVRVRMADGKVVTKKIIIM
ncbi:MAG: T9SS type A sorting domain-containing protein [Bacteroidales bacterium]|nr:T9SS type A sorting domain-containing protein [Bacteroidales bacterium]